MASMKRLVCLAVLCATPALASINQLGVISATTSTAKNQSTTSSTFTIPNNAHILIECRDDNQAPADAYIRWSSASGTVATSTISVRASVIMAYQGSVNTFLSVLGVSGNVNCHVSQVDP